MNLGDILQETLARIDSMSVDEFEKECVEAGYTPVRKAAISTYGKHVVGEEVTRDSITYRRSVTLGSCKSESFEAEEGSDSSFPVAA